MVHCFIDFLKCILCCEDDTCSDPYLDDHDNSYIRIQDQRNSYENFFSRRQERDSCSSSAFSSIYIHEHTLSGSNSTVSVPAKKASVWTSSNHCQVVKLSSASASASAVSSISSNDKPKPYEKSQLRVVVYHPTASPKPPEESESKPSYTPSPSVSPKPPLFAISASSISSTPKPKPSEPSQPRVVVLPSTVSSKPPKESVSKQSHTHSPSILSREQASSPKPPPVASSGTSSASSTKTPPVASSKSKSSSIPSSSSFERHEGDLKSVKAVLHCVSSEGNKTTYAQEDTSPIYMIPKEIKDIIKRDEVPGILRKTLTPLTYKDYFATLLYAEDFQIEKWSEFELKDVSLQLHEASVLKQSKDRNRDA